jgi:signal peptidase I
MEEPQAKSLARRAWEELVATARGVLYFLPFYFAFTTVALGNYSIPSESMVPTVEVGDRIIVSKWAYGYSRYSLPLRLGAALPQTDRRLFARLPQRGDVVVFVHPRTGATMIKRLIGLPGDRVTVRDGVLAINGAPVRLSPAAALQRTAHKGGLEFVVRREENAAGRRAPSRPPDSRARRAWGFRAVRRTGRQCFHDGRQSRQLARQSLAGDGARSDRKSDRPRRTRLFRGATL